MIDTHAHIYFEDFKTDLVQVLKRIAKKRMKAVICPGTTLETSRLAVTLASQIPFIFAAAGVHPNDINSLTEKKFKEIEELLKHDQIVGVGEVGLDYFQNKTDKDLQKKWFIKFIQLSASNNLPLIIHNREADKDILDLLKNEKLSDTKGVFHCFCGDQDMVKKVLDLGFYIGFSGIVTFKSAHALREVVKTVPLDRIVIETDSPYLAPQAYRGRRNEPIYVKFVADMIGRVQDKSVQDILFQTTKNAEDVFKLKTKRGYFVKKLKPARRREEALIAK